MIPKFKMKQKSRLCFDYKWILLIFCGLNLMFMHYYIVQTCHLDAEMDVAYYVDNILGICVDVLFLFFVTYWITIKRTTLAIVLCFSITWIWSITNVMYSRFFFNYLTLSAIGQSKALVDDLIIKCIMANLRAVDLFYVFGAFLFFGLLIQSYVEKLCFSFRKIIICISLVIVIDLGAHVLCCFSNPQLRYISYITHRIYGNHFVNHLHYSNPKLAHFLRGEIRCLCAEILMFLEGDIELNNEQKKVIEEMSLETKNKMSNGTILPSSTNIIIILVESYMSFTSDLKINGKEVTPFLNALKRNDSVYYNGRMQKNVALGSSSDGQFVYMTGLLPLRSVITLSKARYSSMPGLPKMLGKRSRMIIPTVTSMWNQDEMCKQYGFDDLYSRDDFAQGINSNLTDEQVFQLAIQKDEETSLPFLSVILTISMHQPYKEQIDLSFPVNDSSITDDLANYLNACHYTDRQIQKYFFHLKSSGLYDNSLIVIVADHPVDNHNFGNVDNYIPIYLVNVPKLSNKMWKGECNQVDVYTTLLDMFGCEGDWCGLGRSLLSPNYTNSVFPKTWDVSEWIIKGDYFSR